MTVRLLNYLCLPEHVTETNGWLPVAKKNKFIR